MSGFFISGSKYMLLNAASECFLMIFVSNTRMKQCEKQGGATADSLDIAKQEVLAIYSYSWSKNILLNLSHETIFIWPQLTTIIWNWQ